MFDRAVSSKLISFPTAENNNFIYIEINIVLNLLIDKWKIFKYFKVSNEVKFLNCF